MLSPNPSPLFVLVAGTLVSVGVLSAGSALLTDRRSARRFGHDRAHLPTRYYRSLTSDLALSVSQIGVGTITLAALGLFRSAAVSIAVAVLSSLLVIGAAAVSLFASRERS